MVEIQTIINGEFRVIFYKLKTEKIPTLYEEIAIHEQNTTRIAEYWHNFEEIEGKLHDVIATLEQKIVNAPATPEKKELED